MPQDTKPEKIGGSLFEYIEKVRKFKIDHAITRLIPAMADEFLAEKLEVKMGTLLIELQQIHYLRKDDKPIWQSTLNMPKSDLSWFVIRTR